MVDLCKKWTYEYVQREIGNVPDALPILVLANFKDQEEHRAVGADELAVWLETGFSRKGPVFFAESAMSNGFGLMFVYRFFAYVSHLTPCTLVSELDFFLCCLNVSFRGTVGDYWPESFLHHATAL